MGTNGSFASGSTNIEEGRYWKTLYITPSGIEFIELKVKGKPYKLPEESHSLNATYAMWNKPDKDGRVTLKAIARYGSDGKKLIEIHTTDHKGLGAHYHHWKDGRPIDSCPLTPQLKILLDNALNCK